MQVVKINQSANILAGSTTSVNSNVGIIYNGGSSEGGRSRDYDDWDEE